MTGFSDQTNKKTGLKKLNTKKWFNQAIYSHKTGRLREAESIYKKMIAAGTYDPAVVCNLGILCKNSGRIEEALEHYKQALILSQMIPRSIAILEIYTGTSESLIKHCNSH